MTQSGLFVGSSVGHLFRLHSSLGYSSRHLASCLAMRMSFSSTFELPNIRSKDGSRDFWAAITTVRVTDSRQLGLIVFADCLNSRRASKLVTHRIAKEAEGASFAISDKKV